ncbi:nuclear inhibitor of protein phosphatase 1-like [Watersipora subatra]|uniref:nuclear inhibitor of protein phosphatase 1-like n=1 Tax=Watersipora subatra TaxID=2589382 RepID=UPI00355B57B8
MSNANNFDIPSWAGKPPVGLHLDVTKDGKLVQKLMSDQKKCYFFGRNKELVDFHVPHDSCSRVHSAMIWHKNLNRPFLIDLGSTHGTWIGRLRLDSKKPTQVPSDSEFHFGASTRRYVIRERPQQNAENDETAWSKAAGGSNFGLPEDESELEHLTEYNTAQNRIIDKSSAAFPETKNQKRKMKRSHITFNEDEEVINPEDVDPSVGRFRNLIQTTVIPSKRQRLENMANSLGQQNNNKERSFVAVDEPSSHYLDSTSQYSTAAKLGINVPNLAPDISVGVQLPAVDINPKIQVHMETTEEPDLPKKKKYAKEAWPGRKPSHLLV